MQVTATMLSSTGNQCPPALNGVTGNVTGMVSIFGNMAAGVSGAYVSIVNASNVSQEYYNTTSDAFGMYWFSGVNATFNSIGGYGYDSTGSITSPGCGQLYRIYARSDKYGEGYSVPFGVDSYTWFSAVQTSVVVIPNQTGIGNGTYPAAISGAAGYVTGIVVIDDYNSTCVGGITISIVNASNSHSAGKF